MINSGGNDNKDLLNNEYEDNNILNQSILGWKIFNNNKNNNERKREEEILMMKNIDISGVFDDPNDKENNQNNKDNINFKKETHSHKICNY